MVTTLWRCVLFLCLAVLPLNGSCSRVRKKSNTEVETDLFKDIANTLKESSSKLPTKESVLERMKSEDDNELKRLAKLESDEIAAIKSDFGGCTPVAYERDYTIECPAGWKLQPDGSCWGGGYQGSCESRQSFQHFTREQKMDVERRCCIFWPRLTSTEELKKVKNAPTTATLLHGIISPVDGVIISPRH